VIYAPAFIRGLRGEEDFIYTTRGHRRRRGEQATFRLLTVKGRIKVERISSSYSPLTPASNLKG